MAINDTILIATGVVACGCVVWKAFILPCLELHRAKKKFQRVSEAHSVPHKHLDIPTIATIMLEVERGKDIAIAAGRYGMAEKTAQYYWAWWSGRVPPTRKKGRALLKYRDTLRAKGV